MVKDILKDYQGLLLEEKQLEEQLEIWEAKAASVGGNLDGMPRGSNISNPTAMYALKITEIRELLDKKRVAVAMELKRIESAIDELKPFYRYILREYYINDKKWEQIAVDTNYSIYRIWQMHGEALKEIQI